MVQVVSFITCFCIPEVFRSHARLLCFHHLVLVMFPFAGALAYFAVTLSLCVHPQDTTNGNTGDSWCSMGRIAWFDAHARKYVGDTAALANFDNVTMKPLIRDLIADTWMSERYGCDGLQQKNRTYAYFELVTVPIDFVPNPTYP